MATLDRGLRVLLWAGLAATGIGQTGEIATVKAEQAALRSKASRGSAVVKVLERGRKVKVGFAISGAEGSWCSVSEEAAGGASGYVLCAELNRPAPERRVEGRAATGKEAKDRDSGRMKESGAGVAATDSQTTVNELLLHNYDSYYWAGRLGFTAAQRAAMESMLGESGVRSCVSDGRRVLRRYGITDFLSFVKATSDPGMKPFEREVRTQMETCAVRLAEFWERFPGLLSEEQRSRFEADRALVSKSDGFAESLMRLWFGSNARDRR